MAGNLKTRCNEKHKKNIDNPFYHCIWVLGMQQDG
jgi:hypothetical protein